MNKNIARNTQLADGIAAVLPHTTVRYRNVFDLVPRLDRPAALAALRSAASSLQFGMFSAADWILREQEKQERLAEFGLSDLDQRNATDENARIDSEIHGGIRPHKDAGFVEELAGGHPAGFEVQPTPTENLQVLVKLYDGVIGEIGKLDPTAFDLPRPLHQAVDDFIVSSGSGQPANEATIAALKAAGISEQEFVDAGEQAGAKRMERMRQRKPALLRVLEEQSGGADLDAFTQLPIHKQLRLASGMWKGVFARRRQLVTYIASSGKTDQLSDLVLLKNGLTALQNWCDDFETENSLVIEALIDAGVAVSGMGEAIEWSRRPRK